jgi:hypothetical protein
VVLLNSTVVVAQGISYVDVADDIVLLNLQNGKYYTLNRVGAFAWEMLQKQPKTIESICNAVIKQFDVDHDRCEHDVVALVETLIEQGLVEVEDAPHH